MILNRALPELLVLLVLWSGLWALMIALGTRVDDKGIFSLYAAIVFVGSVSIAWPLRRELRAWIVIAIGLALHFAGWMWINNHGYWQGLAVRRHQWAELIVIAEILVTGALAWRIAGTARKRRLREGSHSANLKR